MLGANVAGREEAEEGNTVRGLFHCGAAVGFFALDNADYGGNRHACLAGSFDRVDGRGAGGADVVDDHYASAGAAETLNASPGAMGLLSLAHQKAMQQRSART